MNLLQAWTEKIKGYFASSKHASEHGGQEAPQNERKGGRGLRRPPLDPVEPSAVVLFKKRNRPRNFALSVVVTTLKLFVIFCLVAGVSGLGLIFGVAQAYVATTPDLDIQSIEDQSQTSFIYDCDGNLITTYAGVENREWASAEEIPDALFQAIVSIEDVRFYTHKGIDLKRIVGAFFSNLRSSSTQGGSTITQQLIKMRVLSSEQTYKRKLQEAYLALELEKEYSKEDILVAYLNTINLAQTNYGVKAAAKDYFGKELNELTLRECAMLAGCAQAPYTYDPRANYYTRDKAYLTNKRTDMVLAAMYKAGYIDKEQYNRALAEELVILEESPRKATYTYPYFVEYAISDVVTHMLRQRNLADTDANRSTMQSELRTGGYRIYLTMDAQIQDTVQETLYNWEKYPSVKDSSLSTKTVKNADGTTYTLQEPQAAASVIDTQTGYLVAIVGGRQEPVVKQGLNRATSRQPVGSSMKPIAVYTPALDMGYSGATVIADIPVAIAGWGGKGYPNNSGNKFHGPTTLRNGVINSYNMVAARTLADLVGYERSVSYLEAMNMVSDKLNKDGPGLALGTSGLSVIEMTGAYATLANGGVYREPVTFTKIVDSRGNIVLNSEDTRITQQVYSEAAAWEMTDILEDAVQYGTGSNAKIKGMHVAGKTGTHSDNCGVYFAGYTPYYASAVWVGHDDYKALKSTSGGSGSAPIFQAYMSKIHEGLEDREIQRKSAQEVGLVEVAVCSVSGMLATEACYHDAAGYEVVTDYYPANAVPTQECTWHITLTFCKESGLLAGPYCPEDCLEEQGGLILPEDSIYLQLEEDMLKGFLPHALLDYPTDTEISYDNPLYAAYYCDVHTQEWATGQKDMNALKLQSQELIDQTQNRMDRATLTSKQRTALDNAMDRLVDACNSADATAASIQSAYDSLQNLARIYLG